ncbi:MAG TPA: hypothetical protein VLL54_05425 [Pyrinomonadaceae bacterium]|nr:hypothetical protein [Pyrinomonadaceae bacterium]
MALKLYDKLKHAVRYWLLRRLPACQQTVETLSQSMERRLTLRERITVKLHLWICAWCQWYFEQLHLIRDAARANVSESSDLNTGPGLSAEARERIKRNLTRN